MPERGDAGLGTDDPQDEVSPYRVGSDRIKTAGGSFFVESPLVHHEGPSDHDPEFSNELAVGPSRGYIRISPCTKSDDITVENAVSMTPEQAREVAVTLWTAAEYVEERDAHD